MRVEAALERESRLAPLGRMGQATEVAEVVAFLLSDRAAYLTGRRDTCRRWRDGPLLPLSADRRSGRAQRLSVRSAPTCHRYGVPATSTAAPDDRTAGATSAAATTTGQGPRSWSTGTANEGQAWGEATPDGSAEGPAAPRMADAPRATNQDQREAITGRSIVSRDASARSWADNRKPLRPNQAVRGRARAGPPLTSRPGRAVPGRLPLTLQLRRHCIPSAERRPIPADIDPNAYRSPPSLIINRSRLSAAIRYGCSRRGRATRQSNHSREPDVRGTPRRLRRRLPRWRRPPPEAGTPSPEPSTPSVPTTPSVPATPTVPTSGEPPTAGTPTWSEPSTVEQPTPTTPITPPEITSPEQQLTIEQQVELEIYEEQHAEDNPPNP